MYTQPTTSLRKRAGIYEIKNLANGKTYIGSSIRIGVRMREHERLLRRGVHPNFHLQNSWSRYGADLFKFSVCELIEQQSTESIEQFIGRLKRTEGEAIDARQGLHPNFGYNNRDPRIESTAPPTGHLFGSSHPGAIITDELVLRIKSLCDAGQMPRQVAQAMGLNENTVYDICKGGSWTHITGYQPRRLKNSRPFTILTHTQKADLTELIQQGSLPNQQLADQFGLTSSAVSARRSLYPDAPRPITIYGGSKLTIEPVLQIKSLYDAGQIPAQIAQAMGLDRNTVWAICAGRSWVRVTGYQPQGLESVQTRKTRGIKKRAYPGSTAIYGGSKLTIELVLQIKSLCDAGQMPRQIAQTVGVHEETIGDVCRGKTWSHITGYRCRRLKLSKPPVTLTAEQDVELTALIRQGVLSNKQLIERFGLSGAAISKRRSLYPDAPRPGGARSNAKLTDELVLQIRSHFDAGQRPAKIARMMGLNSATVGDVCAGRSWAHVTGYHRTKFRMKSR